VPDTAAVATAGHSSAMRAALRALDIADDRIGQPLADFFAADTDLTDRGAQMEREKAAEAQREAQREAQKGAAVPVAAAMTAPPAPDDRILTLAHDPAILTGVNRAAISVYVLLAALVLAGLIRRATRLTAHLDACADALVLNGTAGNAEYIALVRTLSATGTIPEALAARVDALRGP